MTRSPLLFLFMVLAACTQRDPPLPVIVPRHATQEWHRSGQRLLLRTDPARPGEVLLWNLTPTQSIRMRGDRYNPALPLEVAGPDLPLYRYRRDAEGLVAEDRSSWMQFSGRMGDEVLAGHQGLAIHTSPFKLETEGATLLYSGKTVDTRGKHPLRVLTSPSKELVVVVSAKGPRRGQVDLIWGGMYSYDGPFYCEIFRRSDGASVGAVFQLSESEDAKLVEPVWAAESQFVICKEHGDAAVWIIEVPTNGEGTNGKSEDEKNRDEKGTDRKGKE